MPHLYLEITCAGVEPKSIRFKGIDGRLVDSNFYRIMPNVWKYQKLEIDTLAHDYESHELQMSTSVFRWIARDVIKNLRFFLVTLFSTYRFELTPYRDSFSPITLFSTDSDFEYWVARHCIKSGLYPSDLDFTLEDNRLKNPLQFAALVRFAKSTLTFESQEKSTYLSRAFVLEKQNDKHDSVEKFEIKLFKIRDAEIFHGRVVVEKNIALEISNRRSIIVRRHPGYIDSIDGELRLFNSFLEREGLERAIYFGSNSNWFHFVVEHAIRAVALPRAILKGTTIIVERGLHPNILELCKVLTGVEPLQMSIGESIKVRKLYLLRESGVVDPIDPVQRKNDLIKFSELLFARLPHIDLNYGPRIFLRRPKKLYRPLQNESEIAHLLNGQDFISVYPEKLKIHEIAALISNAQFIVAEGGAAITNLIFANRGTIFLEIVPPLVDGSSWKPFVEIFGIEYIRLQGQTAKIGPKGYAFDGYKINEKELLKLIRSHTVPNRESNT